MLSRNEWYVSRSRNGLFELARRSNILDDTEVQKLLIAAAISQNNHLHESVREAVIGRSIQNWQYPFDQRSSLGKIRLGETFRDRVLQLSEENLTKHLLAVGQSGSGKTTLFYNLMDQVGKPFWAFDLKQDYRHLTGTADVLVLPWTELKFNPLKPPEGVSPRRWAQVFAEIFGHSTALLSGSKNYLMKKIIELYQLYNLFDRVSAPYPSLHELELLIERDGINYVRKQADYRDTLLNRLEAMNLTAGTVFDCSQGYGIDELLKRNVVFEFDGLSRDVQNFLMEILFAYVYEYRLSKNQRGEGLNHVFFLDEGKRVFSVYKERQDASGIPEIDELTAKMREFGEGLVVADQEASKLTDSIKANTYTKILLPTGDRKQFQAISDSMNLSERQEEFAQDLETGEAIIQVGNSGPVPVKLDNYRLEKPVSDEELQKDQAENWSKLSHTPRTRTPEFKSRITGRAEEVEEPEIIEDPQQEIDLSSEATRFLKDVVENPFRALTERYTEFSSSYQGNKAKNELVDTGVVIERHVKSQDGKRKLLQLTEKGRKHVKENLDLELNWRGRGGIVHQYWQYRIQSLFEDAGWHAFLEKFDADVYVNMGNTELVVEVATGNNPREIDHIQKHLGKDFVVWVACRTPEVRDGLQQRLEESDSNSEGVVFRLFREFSDVENLLE